MKRAPPGHSPNLPNLSKICAPYIPIVFVLKETKKNTTYSEVEIIKMSYSQNYYDFILWRPGHF